MIKRLIFAFILLFSSVVAFADNQITVPVENLDFMRATFSSQPVAVDPPDELPQEQAWWPEVSQWMSVNGWEMVRK